MKHILIALCLVCSVSHAQIKKIDWDSEEKRPLLLFKAFNSPIFQTKSWSRNLFGWTSVHALELRLYKKLTLDASAGLFISRDNWEAENPPLTELTRGWNYSAGLRYYYDPGPLSGIVSRAPFFGVQYQQLNYRSNWLINFRPVQDYRREIDIERNSRFLILQLGSNSQIGYGRFFCDWSIGFGFEFRQVTMDLITDYEHNILKNGLVDFDYFPELKEVVFAGSAQFRIGFRLF